MLVSEVLIAVGILWLIKVLLWEYLAPKDNLTTIKGPPPTPLFGNVLEIMGDPLEKFQEYRKQYGGIFKYHYYRSPVVVISDPECVQCVLHTHSNKYYKEQDPVIMDVIGNGLLLSNGEFWKKHRKIMNPSFGSLFLKRMMSCFVDVAAVLTKNFDEFYENQTEFNLHIQMTKVTLDVIGLAGFGYEFKSLSDSMGTVPLAVTTILHETEERIFSTLGLWKLSFYPATVRFSKAKSILMKEIQTMIHNRREGGEDLSNAKDLLGRLMAATDPDTGEGLGDKQLMDELITFLIAGHETTAASLAFTFYLLSQHKDVERKVFQEIDEIIGDEPLTYELIQQLKYLPLVMKESMRLYPSVAMQTTRISLEDDEIGGHFIPKGTFVELWPWLLHRSEEVWGKDVLEFKPERFENVSNEHGWKYTPFGGGPRNCIGQNLALLESKVILVSVLRKYKTRMAKGHTMKPIISITLRPNDQIMILKKRKKKEINN